MASSDAPIDVGHVALVVRDLDKVATFYQHVLGLETVSFDGEVRTLGAHGTTLLELRQDKAAKVRDPREAGLFHTAFLLPSHQDLANWLGHVARIRAPIQGASDHLVSEAIYLADPEGNGIEVYADTPRDTWQHSAAGIVMSTEHLDLNSLLSDADADWQGMPAGSVIGHVHLQVGAIPEAETFYTGVLGMKLKTRYPGGSSTPPATITTTWRPISGTAAVPSPSSPAKPAWPKSCCARPRLNTTPLPPKPAGQATS